MIVIHDATDPVTVDDVNVGNVHTGGTTTNSLMNVYVASALTVIACDAAVVAVVVAGANVAVAANPAAPTKFRFACAVSLMITDHATTPVNVVHPVASVT